MWGNGMSASAWDIVQGLLGPHGGEIALAFSAGAGAGYAFCMRTVYKALKEQREGDHAECKEEIRELKGRIVTLEERLYGQLRNNAQLHDSGISLLERGRTVTSYPPSLPEQQEDK